MSEDYPPKRLAQKSAARLHNVEDLDLWDLREEEPPKWLHQNETFELLNIES